MTRMTRREIQETLSPEIPVMAVMRAMAHMSSDQLAQLDHRLSIVMKIQLANRQRDQDGATFALVKSLLANAGVQGIG